jgi:site-specific DNA recombinase
VSGTNGSPGGQRALLYARVSTDRQAERYGLDAQTRMLRERAAQRGYVAVRDGEAEVFADDGFSGGDLDRPAMRRLREAVRDGRGDLVLCLDPDRLSRSLTDLLLLADECEGKGVRLEFLTGEFDASPEGRLFFSIRGAVAEFEKAKIRERMMRGKTEKAKQGKVVNPGTLPVWLRSDDGGTTVRLDPHWAEVARMVFRLFVEEGMTLRAICAHLHDLGIATPSGRGTHWQPTTLQHWLRQPAAMGTFYQLATKVVLPGRPTKQQGTIRPSTKRTDRSQGVAVAVPAIVSEEVWQAAQRRLDQNRALASRNGKRQYPLRGLVVCGSCGSRMAGKFRNHVKDPQKARLYVCGRTGSVRRVDGSATCAEPVWAHAAALEEQVWDTIAGLLRDPDNLRRELARRREAGSPTREALEAEMRFTTKRLEEIPAEMDRLIEGYGKGLIPDDRMRVRMEALQDERERLATRRAELEASLDRLASESAEEEAAVAFALRVAEGLDALDDAGRQELLRRVVREVVVHRDRVVIRTVLPSGGNSGGGGRGSSPLGQLRTGALDEVGALQARPQLRVQAEPHAGERLLQPFGQAAGRGHLTGLLQAADQAAQLPLGHRDVLCRPGPAQRPAQRRTAVFGELVQHVARLVHRATLKQDPIPQHGPDGSGESLAPVDDHQKAPVDGQTASHQVFEQGATHLGVLRRALPEPQHPLVARGGDPQGGDHVVRTQLQPVQDQGQVSLPVQRPRKPFLQPRLCLGHEPTAHRALGVATRGHLPPSGVRAVIVAR